MTKTRLLFPLLLGLVATGPVAGVSQAPPDDPIRDQFGQFASRYPQLAPPVDSDDFRHPAERELIRTLMTDNPGIQGLVEETRKDQDEFARERQRLYRLHAVEVSSSQYPEVHQIAVEAARDLGLGSDFTVFVQNDAEMVGNVFGVPTHGHFGNGFGPFAILVNAGMVKALSREELKFVIAREMGHVKANHRFYTALAFRWQASSGKLPKLNPDESHQDMKGLGGSLVLFFERGPVARRLSEYSADRAGLVAVGDPEVAMRTLAKLAHGDLKGMPGFDLERFERQVEAARKDLTPRDVEDLVSMEGFTPYLLNRVGELSRFARSQEFALLRDRATVNPFLLEIETLFKIGAGLHDDNRRLERTRTDAATERLDPLARDQVLRALGTRIQERQNALTELAELAASHIIDAGLDTPNARFDDLVAAVERHQDGRPFAALLTRVKEQVQFALTRPDLPDDRRAVLEARKASLDRVSALTPPSPPERADKRPGWYESVDLPVMLNEAMSSLRKASRGSRQGFLETLESLRPQLKAAGVELMKVLTVDERSALATMVSGYGGQLARMVTDVVAAGNEPAAIEAIFDRYFDEAASWLRTMPMIAIRFGLDRVSRNQF